MGIEYWQLNNTEITGSSAFHNSNHFTLLYLICLPEIQFSFLLANRLKIVDDRMITDNEI